jgi:hypothetical protein
MEKAKNFINGSLDCNSLYCSGSKIRKIFALLITAALLSIQACAAAELSANLNGYGVSVYFSGAEAGSAVTYTVYAPKATLPTGPFVYSEEKTADGNNRADISFELPKIAPSGTYRVLASNAKVTYEVTFSFTNNILIEEINKTSDPAVIKNLLETYGSTVDIILADYTAIPAGYKLKAAAFINKGKGNGYASNEAFIEVYNTAVALVSVEASNSGDSGSWSFVEVVKKYKDILGVDIAAPNGDYNKLQADAKALFRSLMVGKEYETAADFRNAYNDGLLIAFFKKAGWPGIQTYTELAVSKNLKFNMGTEYQALSDKSLPFKAIIKGQSGLNTVDDINKLFNDAVLHPPKDPAPGGGVPGGGNSRGGASYDSGMYAPDFAAPLPQEDETGVFSDLNEAAWAIPYIEKLYEFQIINGVGEGRFAPNADVTREQFVKMIVIAFGFELKEGETSFSDVNVNEWYAPYIYSANGAGIINGISAAEFGTGANISRQDMVVMIYRALAEKSFDFSHPVDDSGFADSELIYDYAKEAVSVMVEKGVINGVGNNMFEPSSNASRAAAAKVISLAMELQVT